MIAAGNISVFVDGKDLMVCCNDCERVIGRVPSYGEPEAEERRAELDEQVRTIRDLHLAKCTGALR
jgi:hypothetical protein